MQESITLDKSTLYICPTPIGNLADITIRTLQTLNSADIIAAEDTRHTRKLLSHYDIHTPLISYHKHNHNSASPIILDKLSQGQSVALVSDAGTPIISDPGENLVKICIQHGYNVISLPGASASITAIVGSGLNADQFLFIGFLDRNKGKQKKQLEKIKNLEYTIIFYESPHRILKTLQNILEVLGNRQIVLARELTKTYEEYLRGTADELINRYKDKTPKGEFVLLVSGTDEKTNAIDDSLLNLSVEEHLKLLINSGMRKKDASLEVAKIRELDKKQIYKLSINL